MNPSRYLAVGVAAFLLGVAGCSHDQFPAYSSAIKYPLRQDPILNGAAKDLGDERYDPDTPGQLPIMHLDDILKPGNPMFAKREEIEKGEVFRNPTKLSAKDQESLRGGLEKMFGTPAEPKVSGIDEDIIKTLKLDSDSLAKGSTRYRIHCLHCHGLPGDGRGPTARWINPHPRDFRRGMFKFQSVDQASTGQILPPMRADLIRTLRSGLEGTAMPSFGVLDDSDLEVLVSYVIHLSIRGVAESDTVKDKQRFILDKATGMLVFNAEEDGPQNPAESVELFARLEAARWKTASETPIKVAPFPFKDDDKEAWDKSVLRGKQLFTGDEKALGEAAKAANCVSCHTDYGRQAKFRFDDWATLARPNNFPAGLFRGGRRPVDIYYRIHSGINGSGMTNFGRNLNSEQIWDLVNFVSILPYPAMYKGLDIK